MSANRDEVGVRQRQLRRPLCAIGQQKRSRITNFRGEPVDILNKAINSTLSRTIITALFTAITMFALYVFGGPAVHGFALTMIIGIVIGTLSSIFFASPILLWLGVSKKDLMPVTRDNPELARRP